MRSLVIWAVVAAAAVPTGVGAQAAPPPVVKRPLGQDVPVYVPALGEQERRERPAFQNPTGELSLRDAVALALLHSPDLGAFAWETRAREARILQAGKLPNPILSFLVEDIGGAKPVGSADQLVQPQTTIQLSQIIELGGKRAARQQLATHNRDLAAWDYETARIDVLTDVAQAFTDVLAAQERVALAEQTMRLFDEVKQSVSTRVAAGVVSGIEETRASVAAASAGIEVAHARRALDASRTRLALTWGSPVAAFRSVVGDLKATPATLPSMADLVSRVEQNPELARWASEISQRQAALAVEQSKRVPDVAVTGGYRRFTDIPSNALLVGASISLPFLDRNHGAIEEARSRLAKSYEEQRAAQARVTAALATAYAELASAHDEVTALRAFVLPGSQQTFEAISEGYRLGKFGYLDVLDAQRTLVGAGGQLLRALGEFHRARAHVERLIGEPIGGKPGLSPISKK